MTVPAVADLLVLAMRQLQAGGFSQAEYLCRQVLEAEPGQVDAWFFLGTACHGQGRFDEARKYYLHTIQLKPDHASAHYNQGVAWEAQSQLEEAATCYRQTLRLEPNHLEALNNLGNVLKAQKKLDEAIATYRQILLLKPDFAEIHANLGNVLSDQGDLTEAEKSYRRALELRPDYAEGHYNLAILLAKADKPLEAIASYRRALSIDLNFADAHVNLGNALRLQGQFDEALAHFDEALRLKPLLASAHWNRSIALLTQGDFEQGWPEYEWRWAQHGFAKRHFPQPLWDGSDLHGRTLLLHAEQGLGDTIQFIRYAPLVKQRGARVIVECLASMLRLFANVAGIDQLIGRDSTLAPFDVQAPLLSLPGIFRTLLTTIPGAVPYLQPESDLVEKWRDELQAKTESRTRLLIGIAWQGSPSNPGDRLRSIPLEQFGRLAELPGVQLVDLQKLQRDHWSRERGQQSGMELIKLGDDLDEAGAFVDTAAIMMNLDLVISADTAISHLAGALGRPVWVALPYVADWRWLLHREDSPWYPSMRLFRQTHAGDWESVFARISEELQRNYLPDH